MSSDSASGFRSCLGNEIRGFGKARPDPIAAALHAVTAVACSLMVAVPLHAQEEVPSEFRGFAKAPAAVPRGQPLDRLQWEQRTRTPAGAGPVLLSEVEQAMLTAAAAGDWDTVLLALMSDGADASARDELGNDAMGFAALAGRDDVVRTLLARGVDPNRVSGTGFTPLGAAAFRGHRSTVRILLKTDADPRLRSTTGQTPLHLAAMAGRIEVIDTLLKAGVDPYLLNRDGDNALDVAANRNQQEAMARLMDAGVDPSATSSW